MILCGNYGPKKSCSNCKHYYLIGVNFGVCDANDYNDCMSSDCCEKFKNNTKTN